MKTGIALMMIGTLWKASLPAAEVRYQSWRFTGTTNNRPYTISLRTDPLAIYTNLVFGVPLVTQPVNGRATNNLLPAGYWIAIDQVSQRLPFDVPDTTNSYNIIELINKSIYVYSPTNPAGIALFHTNTPLGGYANDGGPIRIDTRSLSNQFSMMLNSNMWFSTNGSILLANSSINADGSIQWGGGSYVLGQDGTITAAGLNSTPLNASSLSSGTIPAARFPSPLSLNVGVIIGTNANGSGAGGSIILDNAVNNDNWIAWRARYQAPDGSIVSGIFNNTNHGGTASGIELQLYTIGDMSLNFGYGGQGGRCQAGPSGYPGTELVFQYSSPTTASEFATWAAAENVGGTVINMGARSEGRGANSGAELAFYNPRPTFSGGSWQNNGVLQYRVLTNGLNLRGQVIGERMVGSSNASSVVLDFSKPQLQDITVTASTVTFSTSGAMPGSTNRHRTTFYVRGGTSTTVNYPTGWNTNGPALPASVASAQMIRLELEATGLGETNVQVVSAQLLCDNSFAWDADALSFFTRASITDPVQKAAVNALAINAKAHGWWTICDAIYPFVGGNATAHSKNLKQNLYNITWTVAPTHDANGITGNGSSQYGDTGFNPSTASSPNYAQNSAHLFVYGGTTAPTDNGFFAGGQSTPMMGLYRSGSFLAVRGVNDVDVGGMGLNASADFRGPIFAQRSAASGAGAEACGARALYTSTTTASSGIPNGNFYVLAYNNGGATAFTSANIRGMTFGAKIGTGSQGDWDTFRADWETFETTLSRNAP